MRQAFKIILTTLVGVALWSSCDKVREDLCGCPPVRREVHSLKLTFMPPNAGITPTQADLKTAVVYLFDSAGNLFGTWTRQNPAMNTPYDTGIMLGEDTCRLVAWINPDAPYTITPTYTRTPEPMTRSDLDNGRLTLNVPRNGDVTDDIPMLFYGSNEQVIAPAEDDITLDVPLTLNTYHVTVTLKGVPHDGCTYMLQISDTHGSYDFYNNFIEMPQFDYVDSESVGTSGGTGDMVLSLNMLRLDESRAPMLSIVNTTNGKTVFPQNGAAAVNLMDLIRQAHIDLGTTHRIDIEVPAPPTPPTDGTNTPIVVYVNGWRVVIDGYDINPHE